MNSVLTAFNQLVKEKALWWQDDPRDLAKRFLDGRRQLLPSELSQFGRAWQDASEEDAAQAEELLSEFTSVLPERAPGELIYVMSFFGEGESHLTVLGPTLFPDNDSLRLFTQGVQELAKSTGVFSLESGETQQLKPGKFAHAVKLTDELRELHLQLVMLAEEYGGVLLEEHFSRDAYFPHVSHEGSCAVESGGELKLKSLSVSLHPGARLNVAHAYSVGDFKLKRA